MPDIYNIAVGTYHPQPDFQASSTLTGTWNASQTYICREDTLDDNAFRNTFKPGASPRDLDASISSYWDALGLATVQWQLVPGGLARVRVRFSGFSAPGTDGPTAQLPRYTLRGFLETRDIMDHPDIAALDPDEKNVLEEIMRGKIKYDGTDYYYETWDIGTYEPTKTAVTLSVGDHTTYAAKLAGGVRTYKAAAFVWTQAWSDSSGVGSVTGLGKKDTPTGAPAVGGGRNWLFAGATQRQIGNTFENSKEWVSSDEGGWDSTIYA